jgi:glycerol kinase
MAFQVRDLTVAISSDTGAALTHLRVDGGAAANNLLMQLQADCLSIPVIRGKNLESTGTGAAFLAGLGSGLWSSMEELRSAFLMDRVFEPGEFDGAKTDSWSRAVSLSRQWK